MAGNGESRGIGNGDAKAIERSMAKLLPAPAAASSANVSRFVVSDQDVVGLVALAEYLVQASHGIDKAEIEAALIVAPDQLVATFRSSAAAKLEDFTGQRIKKTLDAERATVITEAYRDLTKSQIQMITQAQETSLSNIAARVEEATSNWRQVYIAVITAVVLGTVIAFASAQSDNISSLFGALFGGK